MSGDIENLVIYMSDGVRWDHHPERVKEMGATFRGVASSLHTPTAIASMLTGQYLPRHRIRGFTDKIKESQKTVLDYFPNQGLSDTPGNFNQEIYSYLLNRYSRSPLSEITEPFGWFMRDAGGHAPYDEFDEDLYTEETVASYLDRHAGNEEQIRRDYAAAVESSVERFERFVMEPLRDRGLLDSTLVVFVSDHGQMLGEHGHVGESHPPCPEVVYVPVTFIHPDIESGVRDELFRHVDLPDSAANLSGFEPSQATDGVDIFNESSDTGFSFYNRLYPSIVGEFNYKIDSVWDRDGGYAFLKSNPWSKTKLTLGYLTKIPAGKHLKKNLGLKPYKLLYQKEQTWGTPGFGKQEAETLIDEYRNRCSTEEGRELDLDDETKENLEELGYL